MRPIAGLIEAPAAHGAPIRAGAQEVAAELPPARVTKGPALPAELVAAMRHKVRDAAARTHRYVPAAVFALLDVHAAGQPDDEWRLTLAKDHPTPRVASKKEGAPRAAEPAWRDLWSGESGEAQQPACIAAAIWGHPGVR